MATAVHLGDMTVEEAAAETAGNWRDFECFVWWREREIEDSDQWMIHYTHHRDSGLLDQSNAEQIREALAPFTEGDDPDVVEESHNHWAVGHIDGFSLRVTSTSSSESENGTVSSSGQCRMIVPGFTLRAVPQRFQAGHRRTSGVLPESMFMATAPPRDEPTTTSG